MLPHRVRLRVAGADKNPEEHACHVRVEDGGALAEREAQDGPGGVRADAFERAQGGFIARQLTAVMLNRLPCDRVKPAWTDVVTERAPGRGHVLLWSSGE